MSGVFFHFIYLKQGRLLRLKFINLVVVLSGQQAGILLSPPLSELGLPNPAFDVCAVDPNSRPEP